MSLFHEIESRVLYKDPRFFLSFPSIATLKNSDILLFFRRARDSRWVLPDPLPKDYSYLHTRVDHMDPRSEIAMIRYDSSLRLREEACGLPVNPEAGDQDPSVIELYDKTLLLASFSWYPFPSELEGAIQNHENVQYFGKSREKGSFYFFWGSYTRRSLDEGRTWTPYNYMPPLPGSPEVIPNRRSMHGGALRGSMVEEGGEVFLASYSLPTFENSCSAAHLYVSKDRGYTWSYRSLIAKDEERKFSFCEPSLYYTPGGKLIAFMRDALDIDGFLCVAESFDKGHNWKPWKKSKVKGHPFHPLKLSDGRVFLSYGYRCKPYGIRARILDSECESIDSSREIILREDGLCEDIGYPWAITLADGRICVAYYFCTKSDPLRHIACSLLGHVPK